MKLIIAEKQIAARRIAEILSKGKATTIQEKRLSIFDIGNDTLVVPLRGHILSVDYPKQYNDWRSTNLHSLIKAPIQYTPSEKDIVAVLRKYAPKTKEVIISTDFDTEGESIGKEAVDILQEKNPKIKVARTRFSAITTEEVDHAFNNICELDYNLADSADARREIDLLWGAVLTRFVSLSSGRLGHKFLSVGRVQTPTLALIVDLELQRQAFKKEAYWIISAIFNKQFNFEGTHKEGKFWKEDQVKQIYEKIKDEKQGTVTKVTKSKKNLKPPVPFNTTGFLRAAANLGLSPSRAMSIAETLYMAGYVSYPRTDNTVYPPSLNLKKILQKFESHSEFGEHAKKILSRGKITPTKGPKKATDHPPITPMEPTTKSRLDAQQWKIYELIVRRFFATLSPKCELNVVKVEIDVKQELFICNGQTLIEPGWKEVYPYSTVKEVRLPELEKGEKIEIKQLTLTEKETKPPARYTPAALIKKMEDLGLGTKSTRPEIIKKLQYRAYIQGTKNYEPTKIAFALIEALKKHASDITDPNMTAELEKDMEKVQGGKKKKQQLVQSSQTMLSTVLDKLSSKNQEIGNSLREAAGQTDTLARCECGGDLRIIRSRKTGKRFVGCTNYAKGCRHSFPLPQKGTVTQTDKICPHCGSPVIKVRLRRVFEMCLDPHCETKKDWGKKKKSKQ
ncbi:DNA topoisomerase I [archaeon]|nr:DNA topoisomerase I [archaeon]